LRAGAEVTCVDDFSDHHGLPRVEKARVSPGSSKFRYVKSDFFAFVEAGDSRSYDACYISSFPPDELTRERIQAEHRIQLGARPRAIAKLVEYIAGYGEYKTWPYRAPPFIQPMMDTRGLLKSGGLLLIQSYRGGVDIVENPHYPYLVAKQMALNDLALLEIHFFRKAPGVILIAAAAGIDHWHDWRTRLNSAPPIGEFHGRYPHEEVRRDVGVWSAQAPRARTGISSLSGSIREIVRRRFAGSRVGR